MPETITEAFVNQYQNTMRILCQQSDSRLEGTTIPPVKMEGEYLYWERLGATEAVELPGRHSDTPNIEPDHSRRRSTAQPYVWATLLDRVDAARMLVDPKGPYQQVAKNAMNRRKDRVILAALGGNAFGGHAGATTVALPAAQHIAAGGVGMTIGKLLNAKQLLDEAEAPQEGRVFVHTSEDLIDLLGTTEVTSADYNTVRALVSGQVDTFLGFKFIQTELIYLENASTAAAWFSYAYVKGAVGYGNIEEITVRLTERADKNYSWQPYVSMDMGATRVEDALVVEIAAV
ncbi:MAG: phage capsid protein [Methanotrichaceae archaeon]|nr:phage capsid protein [Methanotrichaceae archaeon]